MAGSGARRPATSIARRASWRSLCQATQRSWHEYMYEPATLRLLPERASQVARTTFRVRDSVSRTYPPRIPRGDLRRSLTWSTRTAAACPLSRLERLCRTSVHLAGRSRWSDWSDRSSVRRFLSARPTHTRQIPSHQPSKLARSPVCTTATISAIAVTFLSSAQRRHPTPPRPPTPPPQSEPATQLHPTHNPPPQLSFSTPHKYNFFLRPRLTTLNPTTHKGTCHQ